MAPARALAALLACAAVTSARAEEGPRGRIELRLGAQVFDYAETYQGATLDTEQGVLPALSAEGELRGEIGYGRLSLRLASGTVDYSGHVQTSPPDPTLDGLDVKSTTGTLLLSARLEGGALVDAERRWAVFAGLAARKWNRDIHDTTVVSRTGVLTAISGISEVYTWLVLDAGTRYVLVRHPEGTWDLEAAVLYTTRASIDVSLMGSSVSLSLGPRFGWRVASTYRHALRSDLFLTAGLWAEGYAFGQSAVNTTFGILEPDSRTLGVGLDVGIAFGL